MPKGKLALNSEPTSSSDEDSDSTFQTASTSAKAAAHPCPVCSRLFSRKRSVRSNFFLMTTVLFSYDGKIVTSDLSVRCRMQ